jgi:hypothetical protein
MPDFYDVAVSSDGNHETIFTTSVGRDPSRVKEVVKTVERKRNKLKRMEKTKRKRSGKSKMECLV